MEGGRISVGGRIAMTNLITRMALSAMLLQFALSADAFQDPAQEYGWDCPGSGHLLFRRDLLCSTEELARMMESSEVTVIHVGFETAGPGKLRRAAYSEGHLPGARHLKWLDLKGPQESLLPALDRWPALSSLGILPGRRVVLYDTGLGLEAAAAFVALEAVGLGDHAALLDGQWVKWVSEGRPLCRWSEEAAPSDLEPGSPEAAATTAFVQASRDPSSRVTLVDARAGARDVQGPSSGAPLLKLPWTGNLVHLNFPLLKSEEELRRLWGAVPPRADHRVLVGARNWREAAHAYFVARLLGYTVQILDGSIEDLVREAAALERGP